MKVGTLTFPGSPSHGASLQMYALYKALKNMNTDVEVINYIADTVNHTKSVFIRRRNRQDRLRNRRRLEGEKSTFKGFIPL